MIEVPGATPVTTPVVAFTVAVVLFEEDQLPPVTVELKVVVPFGQTLVFPEIVPGVGGKVIAIVTDEVEIEHGAVPVIEY
jgi:hypothetical protein